ncbi:MAG TPA: CPBP family intramembrane metalloprotease [Clostridiaceae bacterium]|nr:CPBP family intramembrane metalloprotease [Clostridiaceae bacterium]
MDFFTLHVQLDFTIGQEINFYYMLVFLLSGVLYFSTNFIAQNLKFSFIAQVLLTTMATQWSPSLAALITIKKFDIDYKPKFKLNFHPSIFLAVLLPVVNLGAIIFFNNMTHNPTITSKFYQSVPLIIATIVTTLLGSIGEEIGWRGYLYNSLSENMNKTKSAALSGLMWGIWHFTKIFNIGFLVYLVFSISMIPFSLVLNYMNDKADGSIIPSILCHTVMNLGVMLLLFERENIYFHLISLAGFIIFVLLIKLFDKNHEPALN